MNRENCLRSVQSWGYEFVSELPQTNLYGLEKLLPEPRLTLATVPTEYQRNHFLFG
jgi:hypothetical protein